MNRILIFSSGSVCRSVMIESLLKTELESFTNLALYSSGMHYDMLDIQNTILLLKENHHRTNGLNYKLHDEIYEQEFDLTFIVVNFLTEGTYEYLPNKEIYYIGYRGIDSDQNHMYHYVKQTMLPAIKKIILREFTNQAVSELL
ncbi:MAG: hypothetical protein KA328_05620 [Sulfurospirillum sp.]|nr:hypothetical protein [Sulfurospirillum sp.]